jgi:hypothetical protein
VEVFDPASIQVVKDLLLIFTLRILAKVDIETGHCYAKIYSSGDGKRKIV